MAAANGAVEGWLECETDVEVRSPLPSPLAYS